MMVASKRLLAEPRAGPPLTCGTWGRFRTPVAPLPQSWSPFAGNVPAGPTADVKPPLWNDRPAVPKTRKLLTPLVGTPSGVALPVPPTKFTVAAVLRVIERNVRVDPPAPVKGEAT